MEWLNNPFVEYGYHGPEYFCDREKETAELMRDLHNESNVALMSPRRIGKSGLVHHVFNAIKAKNPDIACIYIDLLNTKNQYDFTAAFASRVIGALDDNVQTALRHATQFFKGLRPTMTFDELSGIPTFSLDVSPTKEESTIEQVFKYIEQSGKRCYIAFDEFQQITTYPETGLEALLRSYIQFVPNAWFIFAGSEQHLISEMFLSAQRPFYLASQIMQIDVIDEDKYLQFANKFFARQQRSMSKESFHELYRLVDGQTWYVQELLHQLYESPNAPLDIDDVRQTLFRLIGKFSAGFSTLYSTITDNQAQLLRAIAQEKIVKEPMARSFASKHRLPALSSIRQALKALETKQMIYKQKDGYIVYDRFFGIWLRQL